MEVSRDVAEHRACTVGLLDRSQSRAVIRESLFHGGQALAVTYKDLVSYGSTPELREAIMNGSLTLWQFTMNLLSGQQKIQTNVIK